MNSPTFSQRLIRQFLFVIGTCSIAGCSGLEEAGAYYIPGKDMGERGTAPELPCLGRQEARQYLIVTGKSGCTQSVDRGPWQMVVDGQTRCQYTVTVDTNCQVGRPLLCNSQPILASLLSQNQDWLLV
jgi:hypothetical protein